LIHLKRILSIEILEERAMQNGAEWCRPKPFEYEAFVAKHAGATLVKYADRETVYVQGDPTDAFFYIVSGTVRISVVSEHGKEGVVAMLQPGDFFGEGCLSTRRTRATTVTAASACEVVRLGKAAAVRALREDPAFSALLMEFLLDRNEKLKDDLLDQLFNSSERRLARILLTLANTGISEQSALITIPITQQTLASMVGTTRSRINQFMTKFRKLGYINYNGQIRVHNSLLNIILNGQPHGDAQ
jgi:CRP/FNR family transcriptional regulator, cyclic AMP receptor protein